MTSYDENKLAERREGLAKFLLASPVVARGDGRIVERFRRSTAYSE